MKKAKPGLLRESLVLFCEWMGTWPVYSRWSRKEPIAFPQTQHLIDWDDDDVMGNDNKKTPTPPFSFRIIKYNNVNLQCSLLFHSKCFYKNQLYSCPLELRN